MRPAAALELEEHPSARLNRAAAPCRGSLSVDTLFGYPPAKDYPEGKKFIRGYEGDGGGIASQDLNKRDAYTNTIQTERLREKVKTELRVARKTASPCAPFRRLFSTVSAVITPRQT